jgi:hypothetical protein
MKVSRLSLIVIILLTLAAIWGLLVGLVIFFLPYGTRITETAIGNGSKVITTQVSFFETQGWWGIWILIAFAALYYGPLRFYRRGSRALAVLFAVAAIALSVLAGFSIGSFYLPAALALLVGLALLPFTSQPR